MERKINSTPPATEPGTCARGKRRRREGKGGGGKGEGREGRKGGREKGREKRGYGNTLV